MRGRREEQHDCKTHLFSLYLSRGVSFACQRALLSLPAWQSKKQALTALTAVGAPAGYQTQLSVAVLQRLLSYTLPLRALEK